MNNLDKIKADKVLRTLYHLAANEMREYFLVCDENEIPLKQSDAIYRYLDSRGFLEVVGKVGNGDVYLQLSKIGYRFFADDTLVDKYVRSFSQVAAPAPNIYHVAGDASNFGNANQAPVTNTSNHLHHPQPKNEKWFEKFLHDTSTQIVSALVVAGIIAMITWYLTQ